MIYLDSCILIYAIEDSTIRGATVRSALERTEQPLAASPLVLHECLVGALRNTNLELRDRHLTIYGRLHQIDLDPEVFVRAAEIRAASGLRAPDSIHLAAAQVSGCDALWTNDARLASASHGLAVNVLA